MSTPELEDLLARHFEATLDEAGAARLDEILAADPAAFDRFRGLGEVHGLLRARETPESIRDRLDDAVARSLREEEPRRRLTARVLSTLHSRRPAPARPWAAIGVAAAVLFALLAFVLFTAPRPSPKPSPEIAIPAAPERPREREEQKAAPPTKAPRPEPESLVIPPPSPGTPEPKPPPLPPPVPVAPETPAPPRPKPPEPSAPEKTLPEPPKFRAVALTDVRGALLRRREATSEPVGPGTEVTRTDQLVTPSRRGARFAAAGFGVTLEKGSTLLLEQEEGGAVRATLAAGTAFFEVEKRTTPFLVNAGGAEAVVVGTAFQVERSALSVLEGSVRFRTEKGEVVVRAGQRSTVRAGEKPSTPSKADVDALAAWRKRPELQPNPERVPFLERETGANRRLAGLVLAAPFGGGEPESEKLARATAELLDVGLVVGHHFRDSQKKVWINVDRAMEAEVRDDGTPAKEAFTDRARKATADYLDQLRAAAGVAPREAVPMVVQFRNHYEPGLDVCEVAVAGWNRPAIAGLKAFYAQLLEKHKPATRIEMRFQGADDTYEAKGAKRAFLFAEADARIEGYMAPRNARNAIAFFLSPAFGKRAEEVEAYAKIVSELIEYLYPRRK
jgi:FecR-like protein